MLVLNQNQIEQKLVRISSEIVEKHSEDKTIVLAGINNKGYHIAQLLADQIRQQSDLEISLAQIRLNPASPLDSEVTIDISPKEIKNKRIIICDDVASTGRTIFYAFKAIMDQLPRQVEVAVLLERMHKKFPIHADYVGLKLATTTKENIEVDLSLINQWKVELS
ncbi:MAG TPA: phosphoribosyltransferase family protein [Saprospiraceae bacterium]|nr:phosphoribosyltransferase family protein [Saprospiraceae bacterium]